MGFAEEYRRGALHALNEHYARMDEARIKLLAVDANVSRLAPQMIADIEEYLAAVWV